MLATIMSFAHRFEHEIGFLPGAIAVMGKWEPFLRGERCLEEVAARAAAALALALALGRSPYLLSAEARLRGQPRPGCVIAAEILVRLGADRSRVRCCPGANQTRVELQILDGMCQELGAVGLMLITAGYHVARTRFLLRRLRQRLSGAPVQVIASDHPVVHEAVAQVEPTRAHRLERIIARGQRRGASLGPVAVNEAAARLGLLTPGVQQLVADLIRGRARPDGVARFCPELPPDLAGRPLDLAGLRRAT